MPRVDRSPISFANARLLFTQSATTTTHKTSKLSQALPHVQNTGLKFTPSAALPKQGLSHSLLINHAKQQGLTVQNQLTQVSKLGQSQPRSILAQARPLGSKIIPPIQTSSKPEELVTDPSIETQQPPGLNPEQVTALRQDLNQLHNDLQLIAKHYPSDGSLQEPEDLEDGESLDSLLTKANLLLNLTRQNLEGDKDGDAMILYQATLNTKESLDSALAFHEKCKVASATPKILAHMQPRPHPKVASLPNRIGQIIQGKEIRAMLTTALRVKADQNLNIEVAARITDPKLPAVAHLSDDHIRLRISRIAHEALQQERLSASPDKTRVAALLAFTSIATAPATASPNPSSEHRVGK